jgi:integrase
MASLQSRHAKSCALGKAWTKADRARPDGCTCEPMYYVVASLGAGGRWSVGKSFKAAKEKLQNTQSDINKGEHEPVVNKPFDEWADEWFTSLRRPNASTLRSYRSTVAYAKEAFGSKAVRKITVHDVERFLSLMTRDVTGEDGKVTSEPISASTQAKHLRVLSAMFKVAIKRGLTSRNPVASLDDSQRPQVERNEAPYFTDDEVAPLLAALHGNDRALVKLALLTGMRAGELLALRWSHVDLTEKTIHVREAYKDGLGVSAPKSKRSLRDVELTGYAIKALGDLLREQGVQDEDALLFPPLVKSSDGYRRVYDVSRGLLYPAMERAGISRSGNRLTPPTEAERTFHSLRHTFARVALENAADLGWVSRQMGHSSTMVTDQRYGHWSKAARKREVAKLEGAWTL